MPGRPAQLQLRSVQDGQVPVPHCAIWTKVRLSNESSLKGSAGQIQSLTLSCCWVFPIGRLSLCIVGGSFYMKCVESTRENLVIGKHSSGGTNNVWEESTKLWLLKQHTEATILTVFECTLAWKFRFHRYNQIKTRSYSIRGLFHPITAVLRRTRQFGHIWHLLKENAILHRDYGHILISQGIPAVTRS